MRFFHLSDLHLGLRVNGYSLLDDQREILNQILALARQYRPQAILISGDVYDKPVPPTEALRLFDDFLVSVTALGIRALVISGNHDSLDRLCFGSRLMEHSGVHLNRLYDGTPDTVTLTDEYGPVHFYLLPFLRPANVKAFFPEERIETYTDAMSVAIGKLQIRQEERNVLLAHQFVTGSVVSDSEQVNIGGLDNVDGTVFAPFDYTALGHIHRPQNACGPYVRYCGTPLCYSFSEMNHQKSVTMVDLGEKGNIAVSTLPLDPIRPWREIRGTYEALTAKAFYHGTDLPESYLRVILTNQEDVPDAYAKLRTIYHNLMVIRYDNDRTRQEAVMDAVDTQSQTPLELFRALYETQNNQPMGPEQEKLLTELIEKIWGDAQ